MEKLNKAILIGDLEYVRSMVRCSDIQRQLPKCSDRQMLSILNLAVEAETNQIAKDAIIRYLCNYLSMEAKAEALSYFSGNEKYLSQVDTMLALGVAVDGHYQNRTALQIATSKGNEKMVHLLLKYGANPNAPGAFGTAMEEAKAMKNRPSFSGMMEAALRGKHKSPFDFTDKIGVIKQLNVWHYYVEEFLRLNYNDTIYVIALDEGDLKANSEEAFEQRLRRLQLEDPDKYRCENTINHLKYNVDNFTHIIKVDRIPYLTKSIEANLNLSFLKPKDEENRTKSDLLIEGLTLNQDVLFQQMKKSNDFKIMIPENG